jgi:hypothetical protein
MIVFVKNTIVLTDAERMELNQRAASRSGRADDARRVTSWTAMMRLSIARTAAQVWPASSSNISRAWRKRFREERLAGLFSRHAGQEATTLTPALEATAEVGSLIIPLSQVK